MADEADRSDARVEAFVSNGVQAATRAAQEIPVGEPGDCEYCGEWSSRLVQGACCPCRDRYKLQ